MDSRDTGNKFFHELIESLVQGKDISYLAFMLAREVACPVIVTNEVNRVLAFHDPTGTGPKVKEFFFSPINYEAIVRNDFSEGVEVHDFYQGQLEEGGHCLRYCRITINVDAEFLGSLFVFIMDDELESRVREAILSTKLALSLALKSDWKNRKEQEQLQDEFIRDVLYNNYESRTSIHEKACLWNLTFKGPFIISVLEVEKNKLKFARELSPRRFNLQAPTYAVISHQLVIIFSLDNLDKTRSRKDLQEFFEEFLMRLSNANLDLVKIGIGTSVESVTDLYKSYQEAKVALELGKVFNKGTICSFEDLGFLKFIFNQPATELQDFSQLIIGPLIKKDHEEETDLLHTLQTYLDCNCRVSECAKTMYIHENTLRNRLKKIEQICGCDLRRIDHLLKLYIAIHINNLSHAE